jgi:Major tropism determinant N-terminal domain
MSQCPTVPKRVQLRHDTATNWTTANPLLLQGEIGIEVDTNRMKLGDGINRWQTLPYFPSDTGLGSIFDGGTPSSTYGTIPALIDCGGVT